MKLYHNQIYLTLFLFLKIGSNTACMYFPNMTDVPTINIQSSNIQYFSRTRKSDLTTLFCKDIVIVCAICMISSCTKWNAMVSITKYSSPILYNNTPTHTPAGYDYRWYLIKVYSPLFIFFFVCLVSINGF